MAVDDSINNKCGRKIFGGGFFHDHTAKLNQPSYPWSQNIVSIGLLKIVKGRWVCLPLAFRFYFMKKDIEANAPTARKSGRTVEFQSKMAQAVQMLKAVAARFADVPVLVVADSWFGNDGLWRPLSESAFAFQLLSRLRSNITLYDHPSVRAPGQRGRARKYGMRLGSVSDMAGAYREQARCVSVFLYGKTREVQAYDRVLMLKNLRCPGSRGVGSSYSVILARSLDSSSNANADSLKGRHSPLLPNQLSATTSTGVSANRAATALSIWAACAILD